MRIDLYFNVVWGTNKYTYKKYISFFQSVQEINTDFVLYFKEFKYSQHPFFSCLY